MWHGQTRQRVLHGIRGRHWHTYRGRLPHRPCARQTKRRGHHELRRLRRRCRAWKTPPIRRSLVAGKLIGPLPPARTPPTVPDPPALLMSSAGRLFIQSSIHLTDGTAQRQGRGDPPPVVWRTSACVLATDYISFAHAMRIEQRPVACNRRMGRAVGATPLGIQFVVGALPRSFGVTTLHSASRKDVDLTRAQRLARHADVAVMGDTKGGPLEAPMISPASGCGRVRFTNGGHQLGRVQAMDERYAGRATSPPTGR